MNIREQVEILLAQGAEFIVVGGQAGVLRQVIEFSHDLDILIDATPSNAARVQAAVKAITGENPPIDLLLGRDFQQYVEPESGTELDVHLKLIAIPNYAAGLLNASPVEFLGVSAPTLELCALYASKRTDRPRDAVHRLAIEARLRRLVFDDRIEPDDLVLACCLDAEVAALPSLAPTLLKRAATTSQPLLQIRLAVLELAPNELARNPSLHATPRALAELPDAQRAKLVAQPARLAALLSRVPLLLPEQGHRLRWRR